MHVTLVPFFFALRFFFSNFLFILFFAVWMAFIVVTTHFSSNSLVVLVLIFDLFYSSCSPYFHHLIPRFPVFSPVFSPLSSALILTLLLCEAIVHAPSLLIASTLDNFVVIVISFTVFPNISFVNEVVVSQLSVKVAKHGILYQQCSMYSHLFCPTTYQDPSFHCSLFLTHMCELLFLLMSYCLLFPL